MNEFNSERLAERVARRLAPGDRKVLDLGRDDDLTYVEIAERVGETETEVRRRMISAMTVCREECLAIGQPPRLPPELSPFDDPEAKGDALGRAGEREPSRGGGIRFLAQITDHLADDVSVEDALFFQDRGQADADFRAEGELLSWIWLFMPPLRRIGKDGRYHPPTPADVRAMWDSLETLPMAPIRRNRPEPSWVRPPPVPLTPELAAARQERREKYAKIEMVEGYMTGDMSSAEMRAFEERLRGDEPLREVAEGVMRFNVAVARQCASSRLMARHLAAMEAEKDWDRFLTLVGEQVRSDILRMAWQARIQRWVSAIRGLFRRSAKSAPAA